MGELVVCELGCGLYAVHAWVVYRACMHVGSRSLLYRKMDTATLQMSKLGMLAARILKFATLISMVLPCSTNREASWESGKGISIRLEVHVPRQGEVDRGADPMGELVVCEDEHERACMGCAPFVHASIRMVHGCVDKYRLGVDKWCVIPPFASLLGSGHLLLLFILPTNGSKSILYRKMHTAMLLMPKLCMLTAAILKFATMVSIASPYSTNMEAIWVKTTE
nr:hypothetical protein Iba_chr13cCG11520 [Ipomoea batatas]